MSKRYASPTPNREYEKVSVDRRKSNGRKSRSLPREGDEAFVPAFKLTAESRLRRTEWRRDWVEKLWQMGWAEREVKWNTKY